MPTQNKTPDQELEQIYLIASGYEWECPHCEHLNHEIENQTLEAELLKETRLLQTPNTSRITIKNKQ